MRVVVCLSAENPAVPPAIACHGRDKREPIAPGVLAERIRRLSDRLVGVGPFGLGLDGVLAWVPVAGTLYSVGAGGLLIYEAVKAGASKATLLRMGACLAADSATSTVPVIGWAVDTLVPGHLMAARRRRTSRSVTARCRCRNRGSA